MSVVHDLLADYDAAMLECPVAHPSKHRLLSVPDVCPRCKSTSSGACGRDQSASYQLIKRLREYSTTTKDDAS